LFLCVSYSIAYGLFRFRKYRGLTDARSFWKFIGGRQVYLHRSALLDYRYYFVCSGLMKPDTHLGENARQIEVSDDQTTPFLFC
jgi:hypothetical protein